MHGTTLALRRCGLAAALIFCSLPRGFASDEPTTHPGDPWTCDTPGTHIAITVSNIKKLDGQIVADLHGNQPEDFLKVIIGKVFVPVTANEIRFCMTVEQPGEYAIAVYHDKNSNRILDKSWLGIPSERVGISNNPRFHFSAPSYEEAAFQVDGDGAQLEISLHSVP